MKDLASSTKLYIYLTYTIGIAIFIWHMSRFHLGNPWMLGVLCFLASLALILKVKGATDRSHYTLGLLVYGFTFALYGVPEAILVIVISNFAEWIWNRSPWHIQFFNTSCYLLLVQVAGFICSWLNPHHLSVSWQASLALVASLAILNLLNHLLVGIMFWLTRGENFR